MGRIDGWRGGGVGLLLLCTEKFRSLDQVLGNGAAFEGKGVVRWRMGMPEGIRSI